MLSQHYVNYVVFMINTTIIMDTATTLSEVIGDEIPESNGYVRKSPLTNTFVWDGDLYLVNTDSLVWSFTGPIDFTHLCFIVQGSLTHQDTTGYLERIVAVNDGNVLSFVSGDSYTLDSFSIIAKGTT